MYLCKKNNAMKHIILILLSVFLLTACGEDNSWSPEDDIKEFLAANPYGVVFENGTKGDLLITPTGLASDHIIIVHPGEISDICRGSKPDITIKYSGDGTYWTQKIRSITLEKDKIIHVTITYP